MVRWLTATFAIVLVLAPGQAFAHPLVDEARSAYDSAQHERGLELLEQAEAGTDLTREDLAELLLVRAMIHRAQHHMDLAEVDLFRLAALDPTRELGREVHPQLRRSFATVRERVQRPIRLDATVERHGGTVEIQVTVNDDVAALTQGFRLHGRADGGRWVDTTDARLTVPAAASEGVEYWVEAIGPGGAVIATLGSATNAERVEGEDVAAGGGDDLVSVGDGASGSGSGSGSGGGPTDEGLPTWPFIVGGVGVAVIAAVVILAVVLTQPTDETQLTPPSVQSLVSAPLELLRFDP